MNRHLIADKLRIFGDKDIDIEDLLREKGGIIRRETLSAGGAIDLSDEET